MSSGQACRPRSIRSKPTHGTLKSRRGLYRAVVVRASGGCYDRAPAQPAGGFYPSTCCDGGRFGCRPVCHVQYVSEVLISPEGFTRLDGHNRSTMNTASDNRANQDA
jgi:hypothetical protein